MHLPCKDYLSVRLVHRDSRGPFPDHPGLISFNLRWNASGSKPAQITTFIPFPLPTPSDTDKGLGWLDPAPLYRRSIVSLGRLGFKGFSKGRSKWGKRSATIAKGLQKYVNARMLVLGKYGTLRRYESSRVIRAVRVEEPGRYGREERIEFTLQLCFSNDVVDVKLDAGNEAVCIREFPDVRSRVPATASHT